MTKKQEHTYQFETQCLHGASLASDSGATVSDICVSNMFEHASAQDCEDVFSGRKPGYIYSRLGNPTVAQLEAQLTGLEEGLGTVCFSSGMAAISAILDALLKPGDHLISTATMFSGVYYLLEEYAKQFNVSITYVKSADLAGFEAAFQENTKAIFAESVGNPISDVSPIKHLVSLANTHKVPFILDNTVPTVALLDAKALGVDVVWYSLSKSMGGVGAAIGGAVIDTGLFDWKGYQAESISEYAKQFGQFAFLNRLRFLRSQRGACLSPYEAFFIGFNLQSLSLRIEKQSENALALAHFLKGQQDNNLKLKAVHYPGLKSLDGPFAVFKSEAVGGLLALEMDSKKSAQNLINALQLVKIGANIGDLKTLAILPESTLYRNVDADMKKHIGSIEGLVRISVGIEGIDDLVADFKQALEALN